MRPNKVDEALQLFAALQDTLQIETRQRDANRVVRAASAEPSLRGLQRRRRSGRETRAPASSRPSSLVQSASSATDLQRRLEVADGIMRRLHAKNQRLLQRLTALQRDEGEGNEATVRRLRDKLQQREEEVRRLRHRLREFEKRAEDSSRGTSGGVRGGSGGDAAVSLLTLRVKQLEEQYNRLLGRRVADALRTESAGKHDAELRELFSLMKSKIIADARHHEAEVLLLNEALLESERRLATIPSGGTGLDV
ncbi:hypothetical protein C3747_64g188 [Trypanosoma cruzi]|uniref:Uncharacterized protein n=2 Tax=Trypanosoma cruzi TaxID=5693 RepID=Q4CY80_TRYCC|nr:hypothetical protein, conserved [Trypanosoma cruzi]EAN85229.1 hypothetical protein, conserved [Trypanosoma cruzi]PWV10867.1 hypothetical protein C3747_64g188 [Trypanosoma cruzi]RNC43742.1 hypothetical protein TcCL_NonESM06555 [Trypanosoma cruzi]|eukprot:XP_807080.1 hypothetical protein [Trypanosoma cruzi strain CL Brener]